jgi:hypothetical protein
MRLDEAAEEAVSILASGMGLTAAILLAAAAALLI